jgi:hypothetical protein
VPERYLRPVMRCLALDFGVLAQDPLGFGPESDRVAHSRLVLQPHLF